MKKILILGGGLAGLASAWSFLRRGCNVTLIENQLIPNPTGSSFDDQRLFRYTFGKNPDFPLDLLPDALANWHKLADDLNYSPLYETGTLTLDSARSRWIDEESDRLRGMAQKVELLGGWDLARRFPQLETRGKRGLLASGGYIIFAKKVICRLYDWISANEQGEIRQSTRAEEVLSGSAGLRLASGEMLEGDILLLAPGTFVKELLPELSLRFELVRRASLFFDLPEARQEEFSRLPLVLQFAKKKTLLLAPPVAGTPLKLVGGDMETIENGNREQEMAPPDCERWQEASETLLRQAKTNGPQVVSARWNYFIGKNKVLPNIQSLGESTRLITSVTGVSYAFLPLLCEALAESLLGLPEPRYAPWLEQFSKDG